MTVETTISRAGPYAGAGTFGPFPVPFRFLENSHLRLLKANVATGAVATLVLDTDYTVTGAGNETGAVTLANILAAGYTLTVLRNVPATQEADYVENDPFPAESHEAALDKLTMLVQQQGEVQARALVVPATDPVASRELPSAAARARRYLSFNELGEPVATTFDIDAISEASQAAIDAAARAANSEADAETAAATAVERAEFVKNTVDGVTPTVARFSGNGAQTVYTLPSFPGAEENTDVFISGVYQQKDTYSVDGDKLTFNAAPPIGTNNIEVNIAPNVALAIGDAAGIRIDDNGTIRSLDYYVKETRADVDALALKAVAHVTAINSTSAVGLRDGDVIIAKGRNAAGDGGGGVFTYYASSTQPADGGIIFAPISGAGRFIRDGWTVIGFNGPVFASWFGAKGDGNVSSSTANTAAIQAALSHVSVTTWTGSVTGAWTKGGGEVRLPGGTCCVNDTLKVGANTLLSAEGPVGATARFITDNTGTILKWTGGKVMKWVVSSATYEAATGNFAPAAAIYTGADHDNHTITLCNGIRVRGISIDAGNAFGGLRLLSASDFDVQNVNVWNAACGYHFNTSYGGTYRNLRSLFGLYGNLITNCTSVDAGEEYHDRNTGTDWVVNDSTRMVNTYDMSPSAFLPADWKNKTIGLYCQGSIAMNFGMTVCEHVELGIAFMHVSNFKLGGYFEANGDSNCVFVASTGEMTVLANATTSGTKYHFGVKNEISLLGSSVGGIYVGEPTTNKITVTGADRLGDDNADWTWDDAVTFTDLQGRLRVSATGSSTAVFGYTNITEALRRIGANSRKDWTIKCKDGDTLTTSAQTAIAGKSVRFEREGTSTRPTIVAGEAGGGYIYRVTVSGESSLSFVNVNLQFPQATASISGDRGLFLFGATGASTLRFSYSGGTINLGKAYSLFQVATNGALNISAAWVDMGMTSVNPAPIASSAGSLLVNSIRSGTVSVPANISGMAGTTNGWQGTVISSNF